MKFFVVLVSLYISASAFAKDLTLDCSGKALHDGRAATFSVTYNEKDGLKVSEAADDGMSSSSVSTYADKVQFWKEGGTQALGRVDGLKIFLLSDREAALYRLQGWGTSAANGEYVQMTCK